MRDIESPCDDIGCVVFCSCFVPCVLVLAFDPDQL